MGFLSNTWVGYIDRTYQQIRNAVLTLAGAKVPEVTDHTENNQYVKEVNVYAGIAEGMHYYIDNAARESHLDSARLYASAISEANSRDYQVIGNLVSSTDVTFITNLAMVTDYTIPIGTVVLGATGTVPFVTQDDAVILAGNFQSSPVPVAQYEEFVNIPLGTSPGIPDMQLEFEDGQKVVHNSVRITVGVVVWQGVDSMGLYPQENVYVQTVNKDKNVVVNFGDGLITGNIPATNEDLFATYRTTLGSAGNVPAGSIDTISNTLITPPGVTISVTNINESSSGREVETLEELKRHIPQLQKTLRRAVTRDDFIDVAEQAPGVFKAGVNFNCGKTVKIYIVPDGGGVASTLLCQTTNLYLDDKRVITTLTEVFPAGQTIVVLSVNITAKSNYYNAAVLNDVRNNLLTFLSVDKQEIGGGIYLSDLYEQIENTEGVQNSVINYWYLRPYAFPDETTGAIILDWTREINPNSNAIVQWKIVFLTPTTYQLIRSGILLGTFAVGVQVVQQEIKMTINAAAYTGGMNYSFYTYPYNPSRIILSEPSIPVSTLSNLNLTVQGGL